MSSVILTLEVLSCVLSRDIENNLAPLDPVLLELMGTKAGRDQQDEKDGLVRLCRKGIRRNSRGLKIGIAKYTRLEENTLSDVRPLEFHQTKGLSALAMLGEKT